MPDRRGFKLRASRRESAGHEEKSKGLGKKARRPKMKLGLPDLDQAKPEEPLPGDPFEARNQIKVAVTAYKWQGVLPAERGNPEVVRGNRLT